MRKYTASREEEERKHQKQAALEHERLQALSRRERAEGKLSPKVIPLDEAIEIACDLLKEKLSEDFEGGGDQDWWFIKATDNMAIPTVAEVEARHAVEYPSIDNDDDCPLPVSRKVLAGRVVRKGVMRSSLDSDEE